MMVLGWWFLWFEVGFQVVSCFELGFLWWF